ncbi:restriction endonuclease subunit S [Providencia stuartii]|uniref:restriction endonuclease subunit S n=1 Tax=Providencia stuartii TaxID=588 RepID=UPI0018C4AD09|nr:restriction endonuclease subunit S [Providencia stuartii]MBG5921110.1 restriction endonuclease subunit S [Providencia stuartii]
MSHYVSYQAFNSDNFPEHWQVRRLRFAIKLNPSKNEVPLSDSELVSFVPMDAVGEYGGIRLDEHKELGDIGSGYTYFRDNDVIVAKITPCFENGKGAIAKGLTNGCAFGTTELHVLRADLELLDPDFMFYLTASDWFRDLGESEMYGAGGQKRVPEDFIKNLIVGIPPKEEQKAIIGFLEYKTAQIDSLIAKKQTLLDKLSEQSTALISQAVTKGLDPTVSMKDSGVNWLGEVPEHWETWKVTHGFNRIGSGTTPKSDNPLFYDGNVPWVTTSELREDTIFDTSQKVTEEAVAQYSALKLYPKGSLAIAMYGATIGRLGIFGIDATVNQACCVYSQPTVFDTRFVYYWLRMRKPILISLSNGGGQPNLSQDDLKKLWIPIPDICEQQAIVQYLDKKVSQVEKRIEKVCLIIDKLNEYRSALITNAVTGKIDVRNYMSSVSATHSEAMR